jgi:hypothetical protein
MHIDEDIRDTELRLAWRRHQLDRTTHELGRAALKRLSSPGTIAAVAIGGFVLGGLAGRRPRRGSSAVAGAAKTTGVVGLLMTGALAVARIYATPSNMMKLATYLRGRFGRASPRDDASSHR